MPKWGGRDSDFGVGEFAFAGRAKSIEGERAAIDFIENQFRGQHPHQVRWAMFYLGKHGFTESVPLLMKRLDYRYTASRVVTEDYPALKALVWLKRPAADAALKAIPAERSELRLELLCRLVLAVEGEVQGTASLRESFSRPADPTGRKRLRHALQRAQSPYDGIVTTDT